MHPSKYLPPAPTSSALAEPSRTRRDVSKAEPRPEGRRSWLLLSAALVAQIAAANITQGIPTLAPYLEADLNLSKSEVGLLTSYIFTGILLGAGPSGWLTDRIGSRRVLIWGCVAAGLLTAVVLMFTTRFLLPLSLVAIGFVASTIAPAGTQAVALAFPHRRRGLANGLRQTGVALGGALAAAMLPLIAHHNGWRAATMAAGGIAVLAAVVSASIYSTGRLPRGIALQAGEAGTHTSQRWRRFSAALLRRDIVLASTAGLTLVVGNFVLVTYLILYLRDNFGIPELMGAAVLAAAQLSGAVCRVFFAGLSDARSGRRKPLLLSLAALAATSALVLAMVPVGASITTVITIALLFGIGSLAWQGIHFTLMTELAAPGWEARTVSMNIMFASVGIIVGPPLFGLVVDTTESYRAAWALLAGLMACGAILFSFVRERR